MPDPQRIDVGDTVQLNQADLFAARMATAPEGIDTETIGLLMNINAALNDARVLPAVREEMRAALRILSDDGVAAMVLARSQHILDDPTLSGGTKIALILASLTEPAWCDDCLVDEVGTSPTHSGVVGTVTDVVEGERVTIEVQLGRTDSKDGPGNAFVQLHILEGSEYLGLSPEAALRLADLHGTAARLALQDRAAVQAEHN